MAKDIRGSHINYLFNPNHQGNPNNIGKSAYQDTISDRAKQGVTAPEHIQCNLHRSNFAMGTDGPTLTTEMRAKYIDPGRINASAIRGRPDTFKISNGKNLDYSTESRAQFKKPIPDTKSLRTSKEFSKDLRQAHFTLGNEHDDMTTYYHLYHDKDLKGNNAACLDQNMLHDVKKSHFEFLDKWNPGITHYTDQHRWLQPVPKELEDNATSYKK